MQGLHKRQEWTMVESPDYDDRGDATHPTSSRSSKKKRKHVPYAIELAAMSAIAKHLNHVMGDCVLRQRHSCACGQNFTSHNDYIQHVRLAFIVEMAMGALTRHEFDRLLTDLTQIYHKNKEAWKVKASDGALRELDIDYPIHVEIYTEEGASITELRKILDQIPPWRTGYDPTATPEPARHQA